MYVTKFYCSSANLLETLYEYHLFNINTEKYK